MPFGGESIFDALLHPLEMVGLEEQTLLPMDFHGHSCYLPKSFSTSMAMASCILRSIAGSEANSEAIFSKRFHEAASMVSFHFFSRAASPLISSGAILPV